MIMIEFPALYSLTFKSQLFLMFECSEIQIILKSCQAKCQQEPSSPSREAYRASFMGLWPVKSHKGLHLLLLSAVAIWEFLFLNKGLDILILHCLTYYVAHPGTPVLVCVCVFFKFLLKIFINGHGKKDRMAAIYIWKLAAVQIAAVWQKDKHFGEI